MRSMKALVKKEAAPGLWLEETPVPEIGINDVLIEVLGKEFCGILGCDYFSAYRKFMGLMNGLVQFCLAHLIRDVKFLAEHPNPMMQLYAQPILRAIRRLFHLIHQHGEHPREDFQSQLERIKKRIIALAVDTTPLSSIPWYVEKEYPEVFNMAQRFRKHGEQYFTFITTPNVDPTNNAAEQALRFVVMDRRATQGTRSSKGRTFCERIWTVVGTCRMNQRSIFTYLCEAVKAWARFWREAGGFSAELIIGTDPCLTFVAEEDSAHGLGTGVWDGDPPEFSTRRTFSPTWCNAAGMTRTASR